MLIDLEVYLRYKGRRLGNHTKLPLEFEGILHDAFLLLVHALIGSVPAFRLLVALPQNDYERVGLGLE